MWWNEEYVRLSRKIIEAETRINEISSKAKELFEQYQEVQNKMNNMIMYHEFSTGFRFGVQLMKEMLGSLE